MDADQTSSPCCAQPARNRVSDVKPTLAMRNSLRHEILIVESDYSRKSTPSCLWDAVRCLTPLVLAAAAGNSDTYDQTSHVASVALIECV